jgi:hypothetical protein
VNTLGMTMWVTCERTGINTVSSTGAQVAPLQHVVSPSSSCTTRFHQPQRFQVVRPQSTGLITTIKQIHHFTASVIASFYTEPHSTKVTA